MAKTRKYFTLIARDGSPGCPWAPQFGAYDLSDVKAEREEYRADGYKASELRIITTGAKQVEVRDAVRLINKAEGYYSEHSEYACL